MLRHPLIAIDANGNTCKYVGRGSNTPRKETMNADMNAEYTADLLATLPSYTEATFTNLSGRTFRGIARDLPRAGRRWTVEGWEWFITPDTLRTMEIVKVEIELDTIEVIH